MPLLLAWVWCGGAPATEAKLDDATCADLRLEQQKGIEAGLADDLTKGPEWAKTNLNQERVHQIELFIAVDEQVKFGCRDAKITDEARAAAEAARRLELNPDADPLALPGVPAADDDDSGADNAEPDSARKRPATPDEVNKAKAAKAKAEKKKAAADVRAQDAAKSGAGGAQTKTNGADAYRPPAGSETFLNAPPPVIVEKPKP